MNRRGFLSLTGVTALAAASGCMGNAPGPSGSDSAAGTTTGTGVHTTDVTDEGMDGASETRRPYPIHTPEPADISLTVDRLGRGFRPEPTIVNESDATLDMAGSVVRFDTGQRHEISNLRLVPGAELNVVTASEGCQAMVAESYPPIHTRCAQFAEPASTQSGTVTVTNPTGEILAEKSY